MTIYGQTFKRQNNECIGTGATTMLPKNQNCSFLIWGMWCYDFIMMYFVTKYKFHDKGINWT